MVHGFFSVASLTLLTSFILSELVDSLLALVLAWLSPLVVDSGSSCSGDEVMLLCQLLSPLLCSFNYQDEVELETFQPLGWLFFLRTQPTRTHLFHLDEITSQYEQEPVQMPSGWRARHRGRSQAFVQFLLMIASSTFTPASCIYQKYRSDDCNFQNHKRVQFVFREEKMYLTAS